MPICIYWGGHYSYKGLLSPTLLCLLAKYVLHLSGFGKRCLPSFSFPDSGGAMSAGVLLAS